MNSRFARRNKRGLSAPAAFGVSPEDIFQQMKRRAF